MTISDELLLIAVPWAFLCYYVGRLCNRSVEGSVGLPLAFLITMTFMYGGALVYLVPGYSHLNNPYLLSLNFTAEMVAQGFFASLLGIAGIALGCRIATRPSGVKAGDRRLSAVSVEVPSRMIWLVLMGGGSAFVLTSVAGHQASIEAVVAAARNLTIVGICLGLWSAHQRQDWRLKYKWLVVASFIPAGYLLGWGFLSYGFIAGSILLAFIWALRGSTRGHRFSPIRVMLGVVAFYLILSVFVSYMEVRQYLREVLWSDAGLEARIAVVFDAMAKASFFNPFDFRQLDFINMRLNQNFFIGKAITWLQLFPDLFQNGHTIVESVFAWIPRVLWPNKPEMGGSSFVSLYTNMTLSKTTTFGAGPIFELYVNYGYPAVFIGMTVFGSVVRFFDIRCARALRSGDLPKFVRLFLVGIPLINPLNVFFFMVSSCAAAWVLGTALVFLFHRSGKKHGAEKVPPNTAPPGYELRTRRQINLGIR